MLCLRAVYYYQYYVLFDFNLLEKAIIQQPKLDCKHIAVSYLRPKIKTFCTLRLFYLMFLGTGGKYAVESMP